MKRLLLAVSAAVLTLASAHAQLADVKRFEGTLQPPVAIAASRGALSPSRVALADNQLLMGGYYTDQLATSGLGVGSYTTGTVGAFILLPASALKPFDGGRVVAMRVGLTQSAAISRLVIIPIVGGQTQAAILDQAVSGNKKGWNDFEVTTPVTLNLSACDGFLMGFYYNQQAGVFPLSAVEAGPAFYPFYIYGNLGQGLGFYGMGTSYGNLSVQAVVENDYQSYSVDVAPFGNVFTRPGQDASGKLFLTNVGKKAVGSVDYVVALDGVQGEEQHQVLDSVAFMGNATVSVPFPAAAQEGTQRYAVTVTKVNGQPNASQERTVTGLFTTSSDAFERRVVVEELTGTGCQYCPRGMVGMEKLRHTYGDRFVGIALHQYNSSDAMFLSDYASLAFSGAPECFVQRMFYVDPYYGATSNTYFGISKTFDQVAALPAVARISAEANWNADSTQVEVSAAVESLHDGADYEVVFVLVGDSLSGTGSAWNQVNYYGQYAAAQLPPDLAVFGLGGLYGSTSVQGYKFNDVALSSSYKDGENQVPLVEQVGSSAERKVSFTLSLPQSAVLRQAIRRDHLYVAALVIDPVLGVIENAVRVQVPRGGTSAIGAVLTAAEGEAPLYFSPDGRRLTAPQRGLNIVRQADGTTRKVLR